MNMTGDTGAAVGRGSIRGLRPWQSFVTTSFPWLEVEGGCREFRADVRFRTFGERSLAAMTADDCRVTRNMRGIDRADAGHLKILWQRAGSMAVEQDARQCQLHAGMVAICDTGRPYRLRLADRAQLAVLTLPYGAIPGWERLSQRVCGTILGDRTVFAAALAASLLLLDDSDGETADGAGRILAAVELMVSASLHQTADSRRAVGVPLKLDTVQHHVLSHIDDPDLCPGELAAALHVSRRTLYALFKAQAITPSKFIRDIRLRSVRDALADRHNAQRGIFEIALDHGFNDAASFSRTFKSAFGLSPRAWRERTLSET